MGGSESKTVVNKLSEVITDISMKSVLDCQVASDQSQNVVVQNTGWQLGGSYNLVQTSDIKSQCFSDQKRQVELQNSIINAIKQASTTDGGGIMGAFGDTSSSAETNLTSIVRNNVTMSTIQKSYSSIKQKQNVTFNNSGVMGYQKLNLQQGAQIFATATLKVLDDAGVFNKISNHVDQAASSSNSMFNFGSLFSGLGSYLYIFIFIVVVYIAYVLYSKYKESQPQ
jgi:hypothetical protein